MIFPGALGDLLLVLPTLRRLRRRHDGAHATLVVGDALRGLARLCGVAEEVQSIDAASTAWLFGGGTVPPWLARRPMVFSWLGSGDPVLGDRLALAGVPARLLGVERGPGRVHAAVAYARAAGVPATRRELAAEAQIVPPDRPRARALFAELARPVLAIHRGAGASAKRWPRDGFAAVAGEWRHKRGGVIELLGPAEAGDDLVAGAVPVRDWDLPDVAALLGLVDAYVGNDSGVSHLAGAVGCRGVAIFTATDPARWRPLGRSVVALGGRAIDHTRAARQHPSPARVLRALARRESLTSSDPGSSVRA
jgi:ADP-heptose:LPS heptosyltransferase